MAREDEEPPRKAVAHEIGQDLSLLSVEELTGRIALLKGEIERLEQAEPGNAPRATPPTVLQVTIPQSNVASRRQARRSKFHNGE